MPDNEYGIDIIIKTDDARAGVAKTTGALTDLNSAIELAIKSAKLLAEVLKFPITQFEALFDISTKLVRAYDEDARAQERLISTLRLQGDATGTQARRLIEQASALQRTTRFTDEAIVSGQAYAAQVIGSGADMERFTKIAVDLAAALDTDVGSAFTKLVQGVQSGSIRGYVQGISDATGATERMEEVLGFLEGRIGGTAERLAKIGAGPLDQLNNAFGEFQDTLGEIITKTPEWQGFVTTAREFFDAVIEFTKTNPETFANLFGRVFSSSFQLAAASVQVFIDVLTLAGSAITSIFNTLDNLSLIPGFESPLTKMREEVERLKKERESIELVARRQGEIVDEESGAFSIIPPEDDAGTFPNFLQARDPILVKADQEAAALDAKIKELESTLQRLSDGNLFAPIGESLKGIGEDLEKLKQEAADFNPILTASGAMEAFAENTAKAREEAKKNTEALTEEGAAIAAVTAALQDVPERPKSSVLRREADVHETFQQILGPQLDAEKRLSDINKLLADHGALLDGNEESIQRVETAYDEFLIASLEGNTSFSAGVEKTFAQFRLEAEDSAAAASKALNVMADFGTDAILDLVNNGGAGFRELAQGALVEIEKIIIRMLVLQALNALFPGAGTAVGTVGSVAGAAADGGDVEAGRSYIVGERGAEKFTPTAPGRITPLSGGEKPQVTVQVVNVRSQDEIRTALASGEADDLIMNILARHPERARNLES